MLNFFARREQDMVMFHTKVGDITQKMYRMEVGADVIDNATAFEEMYKQCYDLLYKGYAVRINRRVFTLNYAKAISGRIAVWAGSTMVVNHSDLQKVRNLRAEVRNALGVSIKAKKAKQEKKGFYKTTEMVPKVVGTQIIDLEKLIKHLESLTSVE
jgi:hypothetical protein